MYNLLLFTPCTVALIIWKKTENYNIQRTQLDANKSIVAMEVASVKLSPPPNVSSFTEGPFTPNVKCQPSVTQARFTFGLNDAIRTDRQMPTVKCHRDG